MSDISLILVVFLTTPYIIQTFTKISSYKKNIYVYFVVKKLSFVNTYCVILNILIWSLEKDLRLLSFTQENYLKWFFFFIFTFIKCTQLNMGAISSTLGAILSEKFDNTASLFYFLLIDNNYFLFNFSKFLLYGMRSWINVRLIAQFFYFNIKQFSNYRPKSLKARYHPTLTYTKSFKYQTNHVIALFKQLYLFFIIKSYYILNYTILYHL